MGKCKPLYLICYYEPDAFTPLEVTISYSEIESDELNEKIVNLVKDFEKKYLDKE